MTGINYILLSHVWIGPLIVIIALGFYLLAVSTIN